MKYLRQSINGLKHFVFPRLCPGCQRSLFRYEKVLCNICLNDLPIIEQTSNQNSLILDRLAGRVDLKQAFSMMRFYQGGMAQKLLHGIKYQGKKNLAIELGIKFGEIIKENLLFDSSTILVPVPIHPLKLHQRGYNQSEKIAEGLSKSLNIPLEPHAMERIQFHISQTKKGKEARWEEIKNDFIAKSEDVNNRDIILVDDVCTSGATIEACANALSIKKVKSISLLTLAIAGEYYK
jgi:ComF family protein